MGDRIAFYMDEHVPVAVTNGLRCRGVSVLTAQKAGMLGVSDSKHLELAHSHSRVVFTQDADFLRMHKAGILHLGIVYAPQQTPIGHIIRGMMTIYVILDSEEMIGRVEYI